MCLGIWIQSYTDKNIQINNYQCSQAFLLLKHVDRCLKAYLL